MRKLTSLITISSISLLYAASPTIPNIGDALREVEPPKIQREKPELPKLQEDNATKLPKEFSGGKKVYVKRFYITGATHMSNDELKDIVAPYEKKNLSFADIQEVASKITKAYREKGYFVARAYIPKQNIFTQDSRLKIDIIEGRYGEFHLENDSLVKDSILQGNLDSIKEDNIVSTNTLERAMLLINDTPGAVVTKAEVRPGSEVGTSDFIIGASATPRFDGYIIGDNYGSEYTGRYRGLVGLNINSPFGIGDRISLSGLMAERSDLLNGRVGYEFPILSNGTRGEISYAKTTYELGDIYAPLDATGYSDMVDGTISYPVIKTRLESLDIYTTIAYNKMSDKVASLGEETDKDTKSIEIGAEYDKDHTLFSLNSSSSIDVSLKGGELSFGEDTDRFDDEQGANTNGKYSKTNIELSNATELTRALRFENTLQLQYAFGGKNLDGSEDISIGGPYGVKFYPDSEESADNGYIFSSELIYALPPLLGGWYNSFGVFYDVGRAYMSDNTVGYEARTLQDAGVSYYGSYGGFFLNAYVAKKVGSAEILSEDSYSTKALVQGGWVF
jgi:hemolysin activation/secretion protein